jgi:hypothetical protein
VNQRSRLGPAAITGARGKPQGLELRHQVVDGSGLAGAARRAALEFIRSQNFHDL